MDSLPYRWEIRHYAGSVSPFAEPHGISVEVALEGVTRKELIIDFAFKDYGFSKPRSMGLFEERVKRCAKLAVTKGWDPESKGKPFRTEAGWLEAKEDGDGEPTL